MTRELFVSSTPHETKVGLVEDDLLAEIYLERENEYTLAGSIYKGRVTRVLPGMQSAFVDIGLERDAFLYVSDFMELEDSDDLDEVPTNRPAPERYQPQPPAEAHAGETFAAPVAQESQSQEHLEAGAVSREPAAPGESHENRGGFRSRRRRRGRRGERMPESRFAHPATETPREAPRPERTERTERTERPERPEFQERAGRSERPARAERTERSEYGPPPGYQPIILPGESISKYQRMAQARPAPVRERPSAEAHAPVQDEPARPIAEIFAEDEPIFASASASASAPDSVVPAEPELQAHEEAAAQPHEAPSDDMPSAWDREQQRLHQMNVAAVFGGEAAEAGNGAASDETDSDLTAVASPSTPGAAGGTVEEEEIEEEEADLAHYVEDLEEDAAFEELEEETHAAGEHEHAHEQPAREIAASAEPSPADAVPFSPEPVSSEEIDVASADEVDEEAEDEAELDEAQAEAEAALAAEAGGAGMTEARAEVRAPAGTAGYTQRAPRPGYDRRPQRGGRRGGGGRRSRSNEQRNMPLITDLLKEGQEILVQIAKEPIGKKGARITSHIALPGRFLVYMPTVNHTGVSRKIASEEERQRLKRIIQSERENGHGGFIVRTAAMNAAEEDLRADIRFLKGLWTEIKSRADAGKGPTLIYHDLNVVERVLRDQVTSDFSAIWVDSDDEYERILRFANRFQPALVKRVKLYTKETPLYEQFGLSEEINKALKSKVWLKSGGYIVINQTEALVAIDVNTGKYVGKTTRLEDTIVKTNVDAIKEIVRQIRLRDLGGIIIIDFIDMDERRNRQKVMQALEEALRSDRAPSKVLQFNDFGLVAITRKRVKQSLERTIGSPCPYCQSTGFVKSVTTVCNEIYLEMRKIAKHLEHADVMLRVNPDVAKALKANNGRALIEMEEMTKKTVIVKSDPALHQEQFDIN
ncbi:MAG TPA: Rne/Rng family ribonuclease [Terriglobales bacterium]|nr:Rne/Rng family ribonuclease [Terriglobales bacterium]